MRSTFWSAMVLAIVPISLTTMARADEAPAQRCFENSGHRFNEVLACYRAAEASQPLAYTAKDITRPPGIQKRRFELMTTPDKGWKSSFVEAKFADGLVVTTPVQVFPDIYPAAPPPASGASCRTIADTSVTKITFTWRAWADSEYLADRDAGIDAARLCTKAQGQVVGQESLGTRMLGNGTWHATTQVTCLMN